jgi:hypothetical protein
MEKETEVQEQQDLQAGFSAGFSGEAQTEPTKAPEPATEPEKQPAAAAPVEAEKPGGTETPTLTAEDIAAFRASQATIANLSGQLQKAHGQIGGLKSDLDALRKQRTEPAPTPAPPAAPAPEILKNLKKDYSELSEPLAADLAEFAANLPKGTPPEEVTRLVQEQVAEGLAAERKALRLERVREVHEDFDDLIVGEDFIHWLRNTATPEQREIAKDGEHVKPVIDLVTAFKTHRDNAAKAKAKSQERLAGAITPEGEKRPAGKSTLSPDEAARKGYEEGFRS